MPTIKSDGALWMHPSRLPLGGGWEGHCSAPGHEAVELSPAELKECNLGYASDCPRLPEDRAWDAVRFSVVRDGGLQVCLQFVCETGHHPAHHGTLEYDLGVNRWISSHPDPRIQKMAECYLESYLLRKNSSASADFASSPNL